MSDSSAISASANQPLLMLIWVPALISCSLRFVQRLKMGGRGEGMDPACARLQSLPAKQSLRPWDWGSPPYLGTADPLLPPMHPILVQPKAHGGPSTTGQPRMEQTFRLQNQWPGHLWKHLPGQDTPAISGFVPSLFQASFPPTTSMDPAPPGSKLPGSHILALDPACPLHTRTTTHRAIPPALGRLHAPLVSEVHPPCPEPRWGAGTPPGNIPWAGGWSHPPLQWSKVAMGCEGGNPSTAAGEPTPAAVTTAPPG